MMICFMMIGEVSVGFVILWVLRILRILRKMVGLVGESSCGIMDIVMRMVRE